MDSVTLFLLAIAAIFVLGAVGEMIFQKTGFPDVVLLILAGIVLGPLFGWVTRELLRQIAPYFAALTLVVVLFEGGSALKLADLKHAAPRSSALALLTFLFSVAVITLVSMGFAAVGFLPDSWTLMHGLMLGTILGGSSSIIIMPAMAAARLEPKVANLVNLESALTDAFCVVGTAAIIDILLGGVTGAAGPAVTLLRSFGIGSVIGLVTGLVWLLFLRMMQDHEHAYPITLSVLLVLYVVIDKAGGSAALGILFVALILGNAPLLSKKIGLAQEVSLDTSVRGFHRQMAFIIKSFFFVFIGAMLGPPWGLLALGLVLGGCLLLARIPGVYLALLGSGLQKEERGIVTVSLPRGMAAGVLATLPVTKGVPGTEGLPVIVFSAVFMSILIFATGFYLAKRKITPAPESAGTVPLPAGAARPSVNYRTIDVPAPPPNEAPGALYQPTHPGGTLPGHGGPVTAPTAAASPAHGIPAGPVPYPPAAPPVMGAPPGGIPPAPPAPTFAMNYPGNAPTEPAPPPKPGGSSGSNGPTS